MRNGRFMPPCLPGEHQHRGACQGTPFATAWCFCQPACTIRGPPYGPHDEDPEGLFERPSFTTIDRGYEIYGVVVQSTPDYFLRPFSALEQGNAERGKSPVESSVPRTWDSQGCVFPHLHQPNHWGITSRSSTVSHRGAATGAAEGRV